MVLKIEWPSRSWSLWAKVGTTLLWLAWLGFAWERSKTDRAWLNQGVWMVYLLTMQRSLETQLYVLTDGVLGISSALWPSRHIPLATAEVKRTRQGWYIRWLDGKRRQGERLRLSESFGLALEEAVNAAALDASLPRTVPGAARYVRFGLPASTSPQAATVILGLVVLVGLAVWLNQPLLMAPLVYLIFWDQAKMEKRFLLIRDQLLIATPGQPEIVIPLSDVLAVDRPSASRAVVRTRHPTFHTLSLEERSSSDLIRGLERYLRGEPEAPAPNTSPQEGKSAIMEQGRRCSLCGRPLPAEPSIVRPKQDAPLVCSVCEGRVRFEATESGHGL